MKKIDLYIIKRFLSTFFLTIGLILIVVIIFDISEKIDDFLESEVGLNKIIFKYYLNFIPYFINLFSPLFIFISVTFFTSRMANDTEIIAILTSGISFNRLLKPFLICALFLGCISFIFGNFIIPPANKVRIDFENQYLRKKAKSRKANIHLQIQKDKYIYLENYNTFTNIGYNFTLEEFKNHQLQSKLKANYIKYDTIKNTWNINNYEIRNFTKDGENIISGTKKDTTINLHPRDFNIKKNIVEGMNFFELNQFIKEESLKGTEQIVFHKIEKHKRMAFPFSTIILTLIAVAIASRKIKGGIGIHLGLGILIAFTYIMFMQISTTFATNSNLPAMLAVWIPNILYSIVCIYLIKKAVK